MKRMQKKYLSMPIWTRLEIIKKIPSAFLCAEFKAGN
jgi:hypothetical protein